MKVIVQIPCLNEAETISRVIQSIPRDIPHVSQVEVLVIDDGSTDGTAEIARKAGADHILSNKKTLGLAYSFQRGLFECLNQGADIIVNTDGDNQYPSASIPKLIAPILQGRADIVVGDRNPSENKEFSYAKRRLQKFGSWVVRQLSGVDVFDAVSGFRAYSRDAALKTQVFTRFSYTTETLIGAGRRGLSVASVPVNTNAHSRPSRLSSSIWKFLRRQFVTIVRSYVMYSPLRAFSMVGLVMIAVGTIPILRFLVLTAMGDGQGHIQSLVLGSMFFILGYFTLIIALLSDTIATNRQLSEAALEAVRRIELMARSAEDD